jgi:hypothetical protein
MFRDSNCLVFAASSLEMSVPAKLRDSNRCGRDGEEGLFDSKSTLKPKGRGAFMMRPIGTLRQITVWSSAQRWPPILASAFCRGSGPTRGRRRPCAGSCLRSPEPGPDAFRHPAQPRPAHRYPRTGLCGPRSCRRWSSPPVASRHRLLCRPSRTPLRYRMACACNMTS